MSENLTDFMKKLEATEPPDARAELARRAEEIASLKAVAAESQSEAKKCLDALDELSVAIAGKKEVSLVELKAVLKRMKDWTEAVILLNRCRNLLDSIAHEIRDREDRLSEPNWNEGYHLPLTITVGEARRVFSLTDELDEFWRRNRIPPDIGDE